MKYAVAMLLGVCVANKATNLREELNAMMVSIEREQEADQEMWALSMDNAKYKEVAEDDKAIDQDMEKFINAHPKVKAELEDLGKDLHQEFAEIG